MTPDLIPVTIPRLTFAPMLLLALAILMSGQGLQAADTNSPGSAIAGPKSIDPASVPLPEAFSLSAPRSIADLKKMQDHLTELVPTLKKSTVNLAINGRRGGGAQGSGVIISSDGLILTAAHVSGPPGRSVTITTIDGKRYSGITLGRNNMLDASMVRFESERRDWPAAPLATAPCSPGEWCAVLGHPGGYQEDRGLVLRLGRVVHKNDWLVQTDCELVGGDSGGPLFNMRGEVIGINTRIGESTEFNIHVPGEVYTRDWKRLVAGEDFRTHSGAYLGISGVKSPMGDGLLVERVNPGDAADRDGIQVGDVLLTFGGEKIIDLPQLTELVGRHFPGQSIKITLQRKGETLTVTPRLGMRWDD